MPRAYEADFIVRGDIVVEVKATSGSAQIENDRYDQSGIDSLAVGDKD